MSVTIQHYNYSGLTARVLSVYNPITYVVNSTRRNREDFRYVADIFYSGSTSVGQQHIARLESFPNITNYFGVFDVHRPLESVLSFDLNWNSYGITDATNSYNNFCVKFGEKFNTQNRFTATTNSAGFLALTFTAPHALSANDRIWIDKDYDGVDSSYNGNALVTTILSTTQVRTDKTFGTGSTTQTGYVIEGTQFWDTAFGEGGKAGFICTNEPNVRIGDIITVDKDNKSLNPQYDGDWTVTGFDTYSGDTIIRTNCPWGSSSTFENGMVYIKGSKVLSALTTSIEYSWIMNSVNDYTDKNSFGQTRNWSGHSLTSTTNTFLTNGPSTQKVFGNDFLTLSFLSHNSFSSKPTQIRTIVNYSNGNTQTYDMYLGDLYSSSSTKRDGLRLDVGVGPGNINKAIENGLLSASTELSTGTTINFNNVDSLTVYAYESGSTSQVSQAYTLELDTDCSKYDTYRFMWLNRFGAFDFYNFRKRSDESYDIAKSVYERKLGDFDGAAYGYNLGDRAGIVNYVDIEKKVSVNSDWVSEAESAWLYELFQSPVVYRVVGDSLLPIIITNNSYTLGKKENQKLFNYTVEFKYAYNTFSQRG